MIGTRLLHYEIVEKAGQGGMGVVYRARDSHLDRFVAIKLLPAEKVADPARKARFVQEAKAASALNHPNIVTIHDIASDAGHDFIAMEYIEGKPLDELIPRKGMRLGEALKIASQIAGALAQAHSAGIIHRDLKPSNVMLNKQGVVKLLDFGLAKLSTNAVAPDAPTESLKPATEEGVILGTVAYMSPEQAQGESVDARSDIFSFGAVLYEMVTGRRAFPGDSRMSTLGAIIHKDPEPVGSDVPADLEKLISRCLRKEPGRRFQHMDDVQVALEELKEETESGKSAAIESGRPRRGRWVWAAGALGLASLAIAAWLIQRRVAAPEAAFRDEPLTSYPGIESSPSLSPDGSQVAFLWRRPGRSDADVFVKQIGVDEPSALTDTTVSEFSPAWSPDGLSIAFLRPLPKQRLGVILIPQRGGPERAVAEFASFHPTLIRQGTRPSLSWMPDSRSLVVSSRGSEEDRTAIWFVSVPTGEKRPLTNPPDLNTVDLAPSVSPDGRTLIFSRATGESTGDLYRLELSVDAKPLGEPVLLPRAHSRNIGGAWTKDGTEFVFSAGSDYSWSLWRMKPVPGAQPRSIALPSQLPHSPSICLRGNRLAYAVSNMDSGIWKVNLDAPEGPGREPVRFSSSTMPEQEPDFSPDGRRVAFRSVRSGVSEIWVSQSDGTHPVQLTSFHGPTTAYPNWSPDGTLITFHSDANGNRDVYVISSGGGAPRRLTDHPGPDNNAVWSHDGQWIYYNSQGITMKVRPDGSGTSPLASLQRGSPIESPDGKSLYVRRGWEQENTLWRANIDGSHPQQIASGLYPWMPFRVMNDGVYYVSAQREAGGYPIRFRHNDTGKTDTVAVIPMTPFWGLAVSPDRRTILFVQRGETRTDLRLVENFR